MLTTLRRRAFILALLYVCFIGVLGFSASQLPEEVATHFDLNGRPDGWMSRSSHLLFTACLGLGFPLVVVVLCFVLRFLPVHLIHIPRRDYWLAPERRDKTFGYLLRHSFWFACLTMVFVLGIHWLILQANRQPHAIMSTPLILGLAGFFVGGTIFWSVSMIRHFLRATE